MMGIGTQQKQIKRLLGKGNLTGFEVAKIALSELWEEEHLRDSVLDDGETKALLKGLSLPEHIREYLDWFKTFGTIIEINISAHVVSLLAQKVLSQLEFLFDRYVIQAIIQMDSKLRLPDIVTQKQFQDLRTNQRKNLLAGKYNLGMILYLRAERNAIAHLSDKILSLENLISDEPQVAVHAFRQGCAEVYELVKKAKLTVSSKDEAASLLMRMQEKKSDKEILALIDTILAQDQELGIEKPEPLLDRITATGEGLYKTGLPEWVSWIDEYKHNLGESAPHEVAVIQNPSKHQVDKQGCYVKQERLVEHPILSPPADRFRKEINKTPEAYVNDLLRRAECEISYFFFCRSLLKILSEMTGIPFTEDVESWEEDIGCALTSFKETFDRAISLNEKAQEEFGTGLKQIALGEIQPSQEVENLFRKRLQKPLEGSRWFFDCKELALKEKFKGFSREDIEREWLSGGTMGKQAQVRIRRLLEEGEGFPEAIGENELRLTLKPE